MNRARLCSSWRSKRAAGSDREDFGGEQCREGGQGQKPEKLLLHRITEDNCRQKRRRTLSALEIPESLRELTWQFGLGSLEPD